MQLIMIYTFAINIIGFILMGIDKRRARKRMWRIPEKTLWIIALLGGSFGSLLGMRHFRHKTKHTIFTIGMPLLIVIQTVLIFWVYLKNS
ncbi:membrane protein [Paraliobacillus quinghaiensis]|uniref:Membrane protein n=1 Tax=Paraliobacillus quinghaiensis TaxID=470815 RepID=A0A917TMX3_9BACI|nr:DUF1294 domain-containing protein [Paraliobacillus quinghaiensis]GGM26820.1 membrane protein [Paraliobacillus quinghaiensis]